MVLFANALGYSINITKNAPKLGNQTGIVNKSAKRGKIVYKIYNIVTIKKTLFRRIITSNELFVGNYLGTE